MTFWIDQGQTQLNHLIHEPSHHTKNPFGNALAFTFLQKRTEEAFGYRLYDK